MVRHVSLDKAKKWRVELDLRRVWDMRKPQKSIRTAVVQKQGNSRAARLRKKHPVPTTRGEKHLGAMENQVSATMPPKADDDEPKQG
jgi:hypothetical protein